MRRISSVTIRNVPGAPVACGDATLTDCLAFCCFSEHGLLDALHSSEDGGVGLALLDDEPVADLVGCLHVVWKFAHETIIRGQGSRSPPLVDTSTVVTQFFEHLIHLIGVDSGIHPTDAIRGHLPEGCLKGRDKMIVTAVTLDASETVHRLIVVDPQGHVPGLVVCPTVEVGALFDHGGQCLHCFV